MTIGTYSLLENYMLSCMDDSAHDKEHIYRVLYHAMEIAKTLQNVDYDVLIAACLLHDIGRKAWRRKFCLTRTSWTRPAQWGLPAH